MCMNMQRLISNFALIKQYTLLLFISAIVPDLKQQSKVGKNANVCPEVPLLQSLRK